MTCDSAPRNPEKLQNNSPRAPEFVGRATVSFSFMQISQSELRSLRHACRRGRAQQCSCLFRGSMSRCPKVREGHALLSRPPPWACAEPWGSEEHHPKPNRTGAALGFGAKTPPRCWLRWESVKGASSLLVPRRPGPRWCASGCPAFPCPRPPAARARGPRVLFTAFSSQPQFSGPEWDTAG